MGVFTDWSVRPFLSSLVVLPDWFPLRCNPTVPRAVSVGAYYYPWWDDGMNLHWPEGYLRQNLSPVQEPLLGHYNSRDSAVIDRHLQWAKDYGVNLFVCSWWGRDSFEDVTVRDYLLSSPKLGDLKIALFYESFGLLTKTSSNMIDFDNLSNQERLVSDLSYMAEAYFGHPNYHRIDNKPFIFLYVTRAYAGNYQQAFETARSHIQSTYSLELYLVADDIWWNDPVEERIATFDAITAYNLHGPSKYDGYPEDTGFLRDAEALYKRYQATANDCCGEKVDVIPGVFPAFNDRGVRLATNHYVIPHEVRASLAGSEQYSTFWEYLQMAYRVIQDRPSEGTFENDPTSIIMITSWNEWHEDTCIEPTKGTASSTSEPFLYTQGYTFEDYGFKLLDLIPRFRNTVVVTSKSEQSETSRSLWRA